MCLSSQKASSTRHQASEARWKGTEGGMTLSLKSIIEEQTQHLFHRLERQNGFVGFKWQVMFHRPFQVNVGKTTLVIKDKLFVSWVVGLGCVAQGAATVAGVFSGTSLQKPANTGYTPRVPDCFSPWSHHLLLSCCSLLPLHPSQHLPFQGPGCRLLISSDQAQNSFLLQMAGTLGLAFLRPLPIIAASKQHWDVASGRSQGESMSPTAPSQQSWHFKYPFALDWPLHHPFLSDGRRKQIKPVISCVKSKTKIMKSKTRISGQTWSDKQFDAAQAFPPLALQESLDCLHRWPNEAQSI